MDMDDGFLNCFLTFEKFESETIIESISRQEYSNPCRPLIIPTARTTTLPPPTTTKSKPNFMWSAWSEWEKSRNGIMSHQFTITLPV